MGFVEENIARTREKYMQPEEVATFSGHVARGLASYEEKVIRRHARLGAKVLDVGCGAGREAFALYERGWRDITAIDISPAMVAAARRLSGERGWAIDFREADVLSFCGQTEERYGLVLLLTQLLCHIPGRAARVELLRGLGALLTDEGVMILTTHNRHEGGRYRLRWRLLELFMKAGRKLGLTRFEFGDILASQVSEADSGAKAFLHIFTIEEVLEEVAAAGLELVEARSNTELDEGRELPGFRARDRYVFYVVKRGRPASSA